MKQPEEMPDVIYASATSLDNRGLKNAFGDWIDGDEPCGEFATRYIRADIAPDLDKIAEKIEGLKRPKHKWADTALIDTEKSIHNRAIDAALELIKQAGRG